MINEISWLKQQNLTHITCSTWNHLSGTAKETMVTFLCLTFVDGFMGCNIKRKHQRVGELLPPPPTPSPVFTSNSKSLPNTESEIWLPLFLKAKARYGGGGSKVSTARRRLLCSAWSLSIEPPWAHLREERAACYLWAHNISAYKVSVKNIFTNMLRVTCYA